MAIGIGARDVHSIYIHCFAHSDTIYNSEAYEKVQELLPELFEIDALNRDTKIIEKIEEIRKAFACDGPKDHPTLERFKSCSLSVKTGQSFWVIFSKAMQFEKSEPVRNLCVKKIKTIQDEFQPLIQADGRSFKECLKDLQFFNKQEYSYFKAIDNCAINLHFAENVKDEVRVPKNMYSEKELAQVRPDVADGMRKIREDFTVRAKRRELIQDQVMIDTRLSSQHLLTLVPYDTSKGKVSYPYTTTVCALVYDEVKNRRIVTLEAAKDFAWDLVQKNPLFKSIHNNFNQETSATIVDACLASVTQFNDAFDNMQKREQKKASST